MTSEASVLERAVAEGESAPVSSAIELAGRHRLMIEGAPQGNLLRLMGADGRVCLSIEVTEKGPVIRFEGAALTVQAAGDLVVEADRIAFNARHDLAMSSGGDMHLAAAGDLTSEARIQNIRAVLGNVNLKANDDVRVDGERVMVNCVET